MHIKDIKNKLKVLKKRAQGSVGTAIKVLTATVLGASILVGGYALTNEVVLPNTTEKVESMFAYSADAEGNVGGSGTVEPTPEGPQTKLFAAYAYNYETDATHTVYLPYDEGMTWIDWVESDYNPDLLAYGTEEAYPSDDYVWGTIFPLCSYMPTGLTPDELISSDTVYSLGDLTPDVAEDLAANYRAPVEFGEEKTISIRFDDWNEETGYQYQKYEEITYRENMTWADWLESEYNTNKQIDMYGGAIELGVATKAHYNSIEANTYFGANNSYAMYPSTDMDSWVKLSDTIDNSVQYIICIYDICPF